MGRGNSPPLKGSSSALLSVSSDKQRQDMVSTHPQYITDFTPSKSDNGRSPLAMLAKTCETIGMPDTPSKPREQRSPEHKRPNEHTTEKKKEKSPRATPSVSKSEPTTTTYPGLPKPSFPMFPTSFPYFPMQFPQMPFMRSPCPQMALIGRPCGLPTCGSCAMEMAAFASHPLFSAYMMPTSSASSAMPSMQSYQSLLAAAAASASAATSTISSTPSAKTHTCSWMETSGICGKSFSSVEDLAAHSKAAHTSSPPSSSTTPDNGSLKATPLRAPNVARFHPYGKPAQTMMPQMQIPMSMASLMPNMSMPQMPMAAFNPMALQAMYARSMMTLPQQ